MATGFGARSVYLSTKAAPSHQVAKVEVEVVEEVEDAGHLGDHRLDRRAAGEEDRDPRVLPPPRGRSLLTGGVY